MHVHTAVSIDAEKDWFALDNGFRSSTDSCDGCQIVAVPFTIDRNKFLTENMVILNESAACASHAEMTRTRQPRTVGSSMEGSGRNLP